MKIREGETLLDEKIVEEDTDDSYMYTRVIGELEERFTVSVRLANGTSMTFPEFAFIENNR